MREQYACIAGGNCPPLNEGSPLGAPIGLVHAVAMPTPIPDVVNSAKSELLLGMVDSPVQTRRMAGGYILVPVESARQEEADQQTLSRWALRGLQQPAFNSASNQIEWLSAQDVRRPLARVLQRSRVAPRWRCVMDPMETRGPDRGAAMQRRKTARLKR